MKPAELLKKVRDYVRHPYAWPGGYPKVLVLADGELLCTACTRENYRQISYATRHGLRGGWAAAGIDIAWEGEEFCGHCGKELETAYGKE